MALKRGVPVRVCVEGVPEMRGIIKSLAAVYEGERYYLVAIPAHHCSHVLAERDLTLDSLIVQGQLF